MTGTAIGDVRIALLSFISLTLGTAAGFPPGSVGPDAASIATVVGPAPAGLVGLAVVATASPDIQPPVISDPASPNPALTPTATIHSTKMPITTVSDSIPTTAQRTRSHSENISAPGAVPKCCKAPSPHPGNGVPTHLDQVCRRVLGLDADAVDTASFTTTIRPRACNRRSTGPAPLCSSRPSRRAAESSCSQSVRVVRRPRARGPLSRSDRSILPLISRTNSARTQYPVGTRLPESPPLTDRSPWSPSVVVEALYWRSNEAGSNGTATSQ